jgi:uncharacterized protein
MGQKKVVLDTNSIVSAFGWGGNPRRILDLALDSRLSIITSPQQIDELRNVLDYPRLHLSQDKREEALSVFLGIAHSVSPRIKVDAVKDDPSDNKIIEAAVEGKADYIVTGDKHLLDLKEHRNIRIVTAAEFLDQHK